MDEDSVKVSGGSLGSGAGEERCDFDSAFGDLSKTSGRGEVVGEEGILGEFVVAEVDGGRTEDPWKWLRAGVEAEARGSECNSSVCRGVGDQDGAGDVARGCVILELGDEGP